MLREFVRARWSFAAPERHGGRRALRVFHKDAAGLHAANAPGGISEEDDVACEAFHGKIFADRADGDALGLYTLVAQPEGGTVGTVDEDFAVESLAVDIVLLGNTSWRIRRVQSGSVLVEDAQGAPPTVPFWRGEAPARTDELSQHVAALREEISSRIPHSSSGLNGHDAPEFVSTVHWLRTECGLDQAGAEQILEYVLEVLEQAALASPLFTTRWRWDAGRALALLRFRGGKRVPPQIQRMRADDLLAAVFPEALACQENIPGEITISDHPLIREVMKDVLTEAMDIEGLQRLLTQMAEGRIPCLAVDTPLPSQFSHEILNANPYAYLDDAPLEERRARAVEMRRVLPETVLSDIGRLDPAAIAEVRDEAWPDLRDAAELHDALLTLIDFPAPPESAAGDSANPFREKLWHSRAAWSAYFDELVSAKRAAQARVRG